jgi:hypothetical protein
LKEFAPEDAPTFARALDLGITPDLPRRRL